MKKSIEKSNQILDMICQSFDYLDEKIFLILYKTYVHPNLEYCIQAWSPHLQGDIHKMECVQRRASKLVLSLKDLSYEERLKKLGLTTLQERRVRGDMILVFKTLNGIEKKTFAKNRLNLKGNSKKLTVKYNHTDKKAVFLTKKKTIKK